MARIPLFGVPSSFSVPRSRVPRLLALIGPVQVLFLFLALAGLARSRPTAAQEGASPVLRGEVRIPGESRYDGQVVLHQVSPDFSGEIDSVRAGPEGRFRFRLPVTPDHEGRSEIFFASVRFRGLLYFGPPITDAAQLDSLYLIQAYDTLSVPQGGASLPLAARNLFLDKDEEGWTVTDVFQIFQDRDRTLYSPDEGVVWSYPLPETVEDFQVGQADMAPETVRFQNGRLQVFAPLPPGERFFMVRYHLPVDEFVLPLPGTTDRMEVLVREPGPPAEFPPLEQEEPVELEPGNVFRLWAADNLSDAEIQVRLVQEPWRLQAEWLGILLAGLLAGAGVFAYRRREAVGPSGAAGGDGVTEGEADPRSREELLLAVARLDEAFSRHESPSSRERDRYEARREELVTRLKNLPRDGG